MNFKYLKDNKNLLLMRKKNAIKYADAVSFISPVHEKSGAEKSISIPELLEKDSITVDVVINTTKIMDSHSDVHMDGIWNKSVKEQKNLYHLQEHQMKFDHVISDNVKAEIKKIAWEDLGFSFDGETEALVFRSVIEKARNPFMYEQYVMGYVKEHSVGMRYMKLFLCINSEDKYYKEEKENWDKYIGNVINKSEAEELGYFWAVTEAKIVEGSAVLKASNPATPTLSIEDKFEPSNDTQNEQPKGTHGFLEKLGSNLNSKK